MAEVHGIDLTVDVDEGTGSFWAWGTKTHLQQADVCRRPYTEGFFDRVLMISILEHLHPEDPQHALLEVRRVLRPAGQLV